MPFDGSCCEHAAEILVLSSAQSHSSGKRKGLLIPLCTRGWRQLSLPSPRAHSAFWNSTCSELTLQSWEWAAASRSVTCASHAEHFPFSCIPSSSSSSNPMEPPSRPCIRVQEAGLSLCPEVVGMSHLRELMKCSPGC